MSTDYIDYIFVLLHCKKNNPPTSIMYREKPCCQWGGLKWHYCPAQSFVRGIKISWEQAPVSVSQAWYCCCILCGFMALLRLRIQCSASVHWLFHNFCWSPCLLTNQWHVNLTPVTWKTQLITHLQLQHLTNIGNCMNGHCCLQCNYFYCGKKNIKLTSLPMFLHHIENISKIGPINKMM